jgi:hypothetical protein
MSCECGSHLPDMDIKALREYVRLHIISLEQDLDNEDGADSIVPYLEGAIEVSRHYLKVIDDR